MIFAMRDHRNQALFKTERKDKMGGLAQLKLAISQELEIGTQGLDSSFQPYFTFTTETFLKMSPLSLRRWFALIHQAREDTRYSYDNVFTNTQALRDWVGLTKQPSNPTMMEENPTRNTQDTGHQD